MAKLIKAEPLRRQLQMSPINFRPGNHGDARQGFPAPVYIGRHRFFDLDKVEAWMGSLPKRRAQLANTSDIAKSYNSDKSAYLIQLAEVLETSDKATLGPTDARLPGSRSSIMRRFSTLNPPQHKKTRRALLRWRAK